MSSLFASLARNLARPEDQFLGYMPAMDHERAVPRHCSNASARSADTDTFERTTRPSPPSNALASRTASLYRQFEDAARQRYFGREEITLYRKMTREEFAWLRNTSIPAGSQYQGTLPSKHGRAHGGNEEPVSPLRESPFFRYFIHCGQGIRPEMPRDLDSPWASFTDSRRVVGKYCAMEDGLPMDDLPVIKVTVPRWRAIHEPGGGDGEYLVHGGTVMNWAQVKREELATEPYPDNGVIAADGYSYGGQFVPGIGFMPSLVKDHHPTNMYPKFPPPPDVAVWRLGPPESSSKAARPATP